MTSSGVPTRPRQVANGVMRASGSSSGCISVRIVPGLTVFTRIPREPSFMAAWTAMVRSGAFDAVYAM